MVDLATIQVKAGDGGRGAVSFRHEKYIPRGGPDGGDGGIGGSIYAIGSHNLATLLDFRSRRSYLAENGQQGFGKKMKGEDGDDIIIKLPIGTIIYEVNGSEEIPIYDIDNDTEMLLLAKGGKGGVGNDRFKSSTNRTPTQYTKGERGETKEIKLEIKVVADIGLVGLPNCGKSTLVNSLTNAHARVANYPFTTLSPNLGVLSFKNGKKAVVSDIPGLIEGAAEGKGLGDEFLRHVERTRVIVHLVDPFEQKDDSDMVKIALERYETIQSELREYKVDLTTKEQIVVINKVDITEVAENLDLIVKAFKKKYGIKVYGISAVTGAGLEELTQILMEELEKIPKLPLIKRPDPVKLYTINNLPNRRIVYRTNDVFEIE